MAHVSPELPVNVPTWYYTPRAFARAFPAFRQTSCRALTMLLPPPYAAGGRSQITVASRAGAGKQGSVIPASLLRLRPNPDEPEPRRPSEYFLPFCAV